MNAMTADMAKAQYAEAVDALNRADWQRAA